ncbi:hypothetical protein [Streptomyces sp. NRRL S-337]|uniref:hypothetical protein n=1 Tax=Streptomyces sp. NRRL S-337 TaxID=1463900 RepID=UPI000AAA4275|nr:hypothetical protein [Streptomyces sp. NRRL S-337]
MTKGDDIQPTTAEGGHHIDRGTTTVPRRATLRSAGLPPKAVEGIVGMLAGTRGLVPEQSRDVTTTTPTTLNAWAYAHLRPLLTA